MWRHAGDVNRLEKFNRGNIVDIIRTGFDYGVCAVQGVHPCGQKAKDVVIDFVCAVIRGCQNTPVCESGGFGGKNIRIHKIDELLEGINTANAAGRRLIGDRTRIWCGRSGLWRVLERDNNRSVRECDGR